MIHRIYWCNEEAIGTYSEGAIRNDPERRVLYCNINLTYGRADHTFIEELI